MNQFNISQNNQFGDNNLDVNQSGKTPRKLNNSLRDQLSELLTKEKKVDITSVLGDQEAYQFANEIKQFLDQQGYDTGSVSQAVYSAPIMGQIIDNKGDISKIIIGSRE